MIKMIGVRCSILATDENRSHLQREGGGKSVPGPWDVMHLATIL